MISRFTKFTYDILEISRCWRKIASAEMKKYGLKGACATILITMLRRTDGITAAELSDICGKDKADVSRMLSNLEAKGLIYKDDINNVHYRTLLFLTKEGFDAANNVQDCASRAVEFAGREISDDDREIFYSILDKITQKLNELSTKANNNEE